MLPSDGLEAFFAIVQHGGFAKASVFLHITQSAVSQRITNLEHVLGTTVFVRNRKAASLTQAGENLLIHCKGLAAMESDLLAQLGRGKVGKNALQGVIRIAGFSSILRSVIQPSLATLLLENPEVGLEITTCEVREMPALLFSGATDFIVLDLALMKSGLDIHLLGSEENVFVESALRESLDNILDHDLKDEMTDKFFRHQNRTISTSRRLFLNDIYGIIDGVRSGIGRAVIPAHLIKDDPTLKRVEGFESMLVPYYLHSLTLSYETHLQKTLRAALLKRA